jgi:hypothetical protein
VHVRAALGCGAGEKRAICEHDGAGDDRDGERRAAGAHELLRDAHARAEAVDDLPAMAAVQTSGLAEERRGDLERAERLLTAERCGASSSCGVSRAGRSSPCTTSASASATNPARSGRWPTHASSSPTAKTARQSATSPQSRR